MADLDVTIPDAVPTDALRSWLWSEIDTLMGQAERYAGHGKPLAVHYRINKADAYFQIICKVVRWMDRIEAESKPTKEAETRK